MIRLYARFGKRALDIVVSAAALPAAALVIVPAAVAIRLEDGGPVLHVSTCLGRDRKPFLLPRLRTTKVDAPEVRDPDGATFSSIHDPRCTRVGRVLRRVGLDGLSQLLNVLRGQMSLVGPRPTTPVDQRSENPHPLELHRYDVRPGITGLSQEVLGQQDRLALRLRLDAYYAEEHSLRGDVWVLWAAINRMLGTAPGLPGRPARLCLRHAALSPW